MRRQALTWLASMAGVGVAAMLMVGGGGGPVALVPVLGLLGYVVVRARRRRGTGEHGWSGPGPPSTPAAGPTPAAVPARGSVARALVWTESRHLFFNPWFGVGIGFWAIFIVVLGVVWPEETAWSWWELFALLPAFAHPLVGCAIVASHRGVTRARRDGVAELFDSCPADDAARTRAFLLAAWVPLVVTWVLAGTLLALIALRNPNTFGPIDGRVAVDLVVMSILPVGGTMLAVALGRWAPWVLAPIVAVIGVAVLSAQLSELGPSIFEREQALVSWVYAGPYDYVFLQPPVWERIAWLGGLSAAVGAAALLKGEHSRRVPVALAVGLAVATVAAVSLFRPLPEADAAELVSLIGDPASRQVCRDVGRDVSVCVYEPYSDYGAMVAAQIAPVEAALPEGWTTAPVVFRQVFNADVERLPAAVREQLPEHVGRAEGELHLGYRAHPGALFANRHRLAADAVGMDSDPVFPGVSVAGQARGVVMAWLLTRGLDADDARRALTPYDDHGEEMTAAMRGDIWPGNCEGEESAVVWSGQDLAGARALVALPGDDVRARLHADWEHWLDPATSTDELLGVFGLDPVGPFDVIDPTQVGRCV